LIDLTLIKSQWDSLVVEGWASSRVNTVKIGFYCDCELLIYTLGQITWAQLSWYKPTEQAQGRINKNGFFRSQVRPMTIKVMGLNSKTIQAVPSLAQSRR